MLFSTVYIFTTDLLNIEIENSTQRDITDAGETPHCPHLFIKIKYKTIRHILLVLIYLQFRLGRL